MSVCLRSPPMNPLVDMNPAGIDSPCCGCERVDEGVPVVAEADNQIGFEIAYDAPQVSEIVSGIRGADEHGAIVNSQFIEIGIVRKDHIAPLTDNQSYGGIRITTSNRAQSRGSQKNVSKMVRFVDENSLNRSDRLPGMEQTDCRGEGV